VEGFSRSEAQKCIRRWAREPASLLLSIHARERMDERGISELDVLRALSRGCLDGGVLEVDQGEWKCKMTLRIRGERVAAVVVLILREASMLLVKTVEWEDCQ
jgi:hypothetical protein